MFFDKPAASPFPNPKNTLFLGYNLPAELKTMLSLGWELPEYSLTSTSVPEHDQRQVAWKDYLKDLGAGLVNTVTYFGGNRSTSGRAARTKSVTTSFRTARSQPEAAMERHRKGILAYCEEDVNATVWLGRGMLPELDLEQGLWRGKYCKANTFYEHNGVPVAPNVSVPSKTNPRSSSSASPTRSKRRTATVFT